MYCVTIALKQVKRTFDVMNQRVILCFNEFCAIEVPVLGYDWHNVWAIHAFDTLFFESIGSIF
jgi:hypothetical protein